MITNRLTEAAPACGALFDIHISVCLHLLYVDTLLRLSKRAIGRPFPRSPRRLLLGHVRPALLCPFRPRRMFEHLARRPQQFRMVCS